MNQPTASRRAQLHEILSGIAATSFDLKEKLTVDLGMDSMDLVEITIAVSEQFNVDKPKVEEVLNQIATVTGEDLLALLDRELGPAEPTNGQLHLTEDQFIARYRPEENEEGGYYRQRDWTVPEDLLEIKAADERGCLWTAMDDDGGEFMIASGGRFVNRLYYIITERALESLIWVVDVQDPDESPRVLIEVDWDLSDEDDVTEAADCGRTPPKQVVVRLYDVEHGLEDAMDSEDAVVDWLSNEHGFCVNSWSVVRVLAPGEEVAT